MGWVFWALIAAAQILGGTGLQAQATRSREAGLFLGTWRLVAIESNGKINPAFGPHPVGLIYYDRTGHMAVQIMPDSSAGGKPQGAPGYIAYFGTYTVDEKERTVTHHREGSAQPGTAGSDLVRHYEFDSGGRLLLMPVEAPAGRLVWERIP